MGLKDAKNPIVAKKPIKPPSFALCWLSIIPKCLSFFFIYKITTTEEKTAGESAEKEDEEITDGTETKTEPVPETQSSE